MKKILVILSTCSSGDCQQCFSLNFYHKIKKINVVGYSAIEIYIFDFIQLFYKSFFEFLNNFLLF